MPEQEELRLVVTLDDQASAQLGNLRSQLQGMSQAMNQSLGSTGSASGKAAAGVAQLQTGLMALVAKGTFIGNVLGGIAKEVTNLGAQIVARAVDFEGLSREMINTSHAASLLGTSTAQLRQNLLTMAQAGVPLDEAQRALEGVTKSFVDLQMVNSRVRPQLMRGNFLPIDEMAKWVDLMEQTDNPDALADVVKRGYAAVMEYNAKFGPAVQAAEGQRYLRVLEAQGIERINQLKKASEFQKKLDDDRVLKSKEYLEISVQTSDSYKRIGDSLGFIVADLANVTGVSGAWSKFLIGIEHSFEALEKSMRNMNTEADKADANRKRNELLSGQRDTDQAAAAEVRRQRQRGTAQAQREAPDSPQGDIFQWLKELGPGGDRLRENRRRKAAGLPPLEGTPEPMAAPPKPQTQEEKDYQDYVNRRKTGRYPGMAMGGKIAGGSAVLVGESGPELFIPEGSGTIIPSAGGGGGGGFGGDDSEALDENTKELRRLNDSLMYTQMGGLAPGLGGGTASGTRFPGGGSGPGIGSGGGGNYGGGAASFGGGGGGGASGGVAGVSGGQSGMPVVEGAGVPGDILKKAQEVAANAGPGGVDAFLRQQGYPRSGAWCGSFAASVVKASGGKPPANPEVASNWRNWGQEVMTPQPGDVAVRRGAGTGSTGSHVTFVQSVGQGTFGGLGGNQGGGRLTTSTFQTGRFQFYRGQGSAPTAEQVAAGGGAAGAGAAAVGAQAIAGGSAALAQDRSKFQAELSNPQVRDHMAALVQAEVGSQGGPAQQALVETIMNRASARGQTLMRTMQADYYEPMRTGSFNRALSRLNPAQRAALQANLGSALGGSNVSNLATGNASGGVGFGGGPRTFSSGGENFGLENAPKDKRWAQNMAQQLRTAGVTTTAQLQQLTGQTGMPGNAQLTQGQGVPVQLVSMTPQAAQAYAEAQHKANINLASSAASATAAAIKAGATPEQAAAAGAAAATAAHGTAPPGAPTGAKPDPEKQKQDARAADDARRDTEDERRQAEISRQQRIADRKQIRDEERKMTPEQRAQARQERKEREAEEEHTRQGTKLQRDADRRDARAKERQDAADRKLEEKAQGERDPAGRRRPLRRQTESQRTGQKPWSRMSAQERADTLRDQQIEADRKRKEEEERRVAEDAAAQKLKDSTKSIEELEDESDRKRDPESYIDRVAREQREAEGPTPLEQAEERRNARSRGRDPVSGFSSKAGDIAGRGLDAGQNVKVTADGTLRVDVNAARGTAVAAAGSGAFKKTVINRQHQMEPAESGSDHDPSLDS